MSPTERPTPDPADPANPSPEPTMSPTKNPTPAPTDPANVVVNVSASYSDISKFDANAIVEAQIATAGAALSKRWASVIASHHCPSISGLSHRDPGRVVSAGQDLKSRTMPPGIPFPMVSKKGV